MLTRRFVSLAFLLTALAAGCRAQPEAPADKPFAVRAVAVRQGAMQERIRYIGTVRSSREVRVVARLAGTIVEMRHAEGDLVKQGDALVRIGTPDVDAKVSRAAAELERAQVEAAFACERLTTDQELFASGAISSGQLDASKKACDSGRATVSALQAARRETHSVRANGTERAPFDGIVLQHLAEPGETTMPGKPLLLIGDRNPEVLVKASEQDVSRGIRPGTKAAISMGGQEALTEVRAVSPIALGAARTIDVRLAVPKELRAFARNGISVDVSFVLRAATDTTSVPTRAVRKAAAERFVYSLDGGTARRHAVTPGIEDEGWVSIEPPLRPGTLVAVTGLNTLQDGTPVFVVNDTEAGQ